MLLFSVTEKEGKQRSWRRSPLKRVFLSHAEKSGFSRPYLKEASPITYIEHYLFPR